MITIAGFIVVRRLGHIDPVGPGEVDIPPSRIGNVFYGGVFRRPWAEVHYHYYCGTLPPPLMEIERCIKNADNYYLGLEVCQDLSQAAALLEFSRSLVPENDLIAVISPQLLEAKGGANVDDDLIDWLGIDIITPGSASLLEYGLFLKPELFPGWEGALLPTGLLADGVSVDAYVAAYRAGVMRGQLENFLEPLPGYQIDAIRVGAVRNDGLRGVARKPL